MKEFLSQQRIDYVERDVAQDADALGELEALGILTTPVTVIGGELVVGFDRPKLERPSEKSKSSGIGVKFKMATKTFKVPNISCGHCVMTIEREVGELQGVASVKAEEASKMVTVNWNEPPATWDGIRALLEEINYPPES